MREQFLAFIDSPGDETYRRVWESVTSAPDYDPYANDLHELEQLYEQDRWDDLRRRAHEVMSRWLLSPRLHFLLSFAARKSGNEQGASAESFIGRALIHGILSTGDGTESQPYLITSTTDEYDVFMMLGKELKMQSAVEKGDRKFDRLQFTDGSEMWFDITVMFRVLQRKFGG